jgi:hypothetical protein
VSIVIKMFALFKSFGNTALCTIGLVCKYIPIFIEFFPNNGLAHSAQELY